MIHGDHQKSVFPHTTLSSDRGITTWEAYAASVNPALDLVQEWTGKKHPSHAEIVQAIAEIKCYAADATTQEEQR